MNKMIIIAEANFLESLLYRIYIGSEEFTSVNWHSARLRLQTIRNEARNVPFTNLSSLEPNK